MYEEQTLPPVTWSMSRTCCCCCCSCCCYRFGLSLTDFMTSSWKYPFSYSTLSRDQPMLFLLALYQTFEIGQRRRINKRKEKRKRAEKIVNIVIWFQKLLLTNFISTFFYGVYYKGIKIKKILTLMLSTAKQVRSALPFFFIRC